MDAQSLHASSPEPLLLLLRTALPRHGKNAPRFVSGRTCGGQLPRLGAIARSGECVERCIQPATALLPALLEYLSVLKAGCLARLICERCMVGPDDATHAPQQSVQHVAQCFSIHVRASALSREVTGVPAVRWTIPEEFQSKQQEKRIHLFHLM